MQPCPRPEPAFRLQLTAERGPLPADTKLTVFYQGKPNERDADPRIPPHEDYDVRHPPLDNVDVCCRTGSAISGKLPSVPCGVPAALPDASTATDASRLSEAGSDGSVPGLSDAALQGRDASSDAAVVSDGGVGTEAGSGTSGGAPEALLCDLWTNGRADIVVTGSTYPRLDRTLLVEFDECGVVRRDVRVIWTRRDGGQ